MSHIKHRLLLGAHMSISGGLDKAVAAAQSLGCSTFQLFTKSNRQWYAKPITQQEADLFKQTVQQSDIGPIVAHAMYLINIGSAKEATAQQSIDATILELARCEQLNIPYLVLHPGSHTSTNEQECLERIARNLDTILETASGKTMLLLELMAGQGSAVCYNFEQIAIVLQKTRHKKRLGVCFDTCHAFVAGYDLSTVQTYEQVWHDFDKTVGLEHLKAIHLNDSKKELGSYVDRHESIGKGKIGLEAFELLMNDPRFFDIPKILETPKESLEDDAKNLEILMNLLTDKTKKLLGV